MEREDDEFYDSVLHKLGNVDDEILIVLGFQISAFFWEMTFMARCFVLV